MAGLDDPPQDTERTLPVLSAHAHLAYLPRWIGKFRCQRVSFAGSMIRADVFGWWRTLRERSWSVRLRLAQIIDYPTLRTLWSQTFPELDSAGPEPRDIARTGWVVVGEASADVVAGAMVSPVADEAGSRRVHVLAETETHWLQMHDQLVGRLQAERVATWYFVVREDCQRVRGWLESLGYVMSYRSWGAHLELDDRTDPQPYEALIDRSLGTTYQLREMDSRDAGAAHRLHSENRADFPSTPATETEHYTERDLADLIASGRAFGVWDGGRLCALTVMRHHSPSQAGTEFTVTDRPERGRGLATAVKAYAVLTLWREGVCRFGTGGAEANEASLKANLRLGYVLEPLWITYGRTT